MHNSTPKYARQPHVPMSHNFKEAYGGHHKQSREGTGPWTHGSTHYRAETKAAAKGKPAWAAWAGSNWVDPIAGQTKARAVLTAAARDSTLDHNLRQRVNGPRSLFRTHPPAPTTTTRHLMFNDSPYRVVNLMNAGVFDKRPMHAGGHTAKYVDRAWGMS